MSGLRLGVRFWAFERFWPRHHPGVHLGQASSVVEFLWEKPRKKMGDDVIVKMVQVGSWVSAPDDTEGIENREVYALAGAALYQAQCLEHEIVNSLGLAAILPYWTTKKWSRSRAEYEAHVDQIWDENYERTLGQLLSSLRQSGIAIPATLDSLLREGLEKRNYLVHRYFRERAKDWFNPEGRRSMAAELKSMDELFRKADRALHDVTSKMYSTIGITEEKVAALADLMLADASDEEIDKLLSGK